MTDLLCPVCGATVHTDQIDVSLFGDVTPTYIPGQRKCLNGCDLKVARLLTREDGPVWGPTGECISLGLSEEIKTITGDPNATLSTVMNNPELAWRQEVLHRIRLTADRLDGIRPDTGWVRGVDSLWLTIEA
jgi:hypothetical protein